MIQKLPVRIDPLNRLGWVDVYLPDDYYQSDERYPVVYMFDGENLFYDEQATYGTSWGLKEYLDQSNRKVIVVGLECDTRNDNRLHEYTPYSVKTTFYGETSGKGAALMEWIVHVLKEEVDATYRTWRQREATAIAGSSMGGLMAFYAVIHHNDVFSKAACLSPSLMVCDEEISREFEQTRLHPDTRIYWSFGSKELSPKVRMEAQMQLDEFKQSLEERGGIGRVEILKGGRHNESSWRAQNEDVFHFLWDEPEADPVCHPMSKMAYGAAVEDVHD